MRGCCRCSAPWRRAAAAVDVLAAAAARKLQVAAAARRDRTAGTVATVGGVAAAGGRDGGAVRAAGPQPAPAAGDAAGLDAGAGAAAAALAQRRRSLGLPERDLLLRQRGRVAARRQPAAVPAAAAGHQPADAADARRCTSCARTRRGEEKRGPASRPAPGAWWPGSPASCWRWRRRPTCSATSRCRAMLVSATLDSSYVALAMYAGSKVVVALFQVLLAGPTVARLAARYAGSLVPAVVNIGRTLLVRGLADVHAAVVPHLPPGVVLRGGGADPRVQARRAVAQPGQPGVLRAGHLGRVLGGQDHPPGAGRGHPARACRCRAASATACRR